MENRELTVCFTGHRPKQLYGYNDKESYEILSKFILKGIETLHKKYKVKRFITGGAQGVDQLSAYALEIYKKENDIITEVAVPFCGQERLWSDYGLFSKQRYNERLKRADFVKILVDREVRNEEVPKLLNDRNIYMVNESDFVFGIYKGELTDTKRSGTLNCLKYAKSKDKKIIILNPETLYFKKYF